MEGIGPSLVIIVFNILWLKTLPRQILYFNMRVEAKVLSTKNFPVWLFAPPIASLVLILIEQKIDHTGTLTKLSIYLISIEIKPVDHSELASMNHV